jgi:hypothetical protein
MQAADGWAQRAHAPSLHRQFANGGDCIGERLLGALQLRIGLREAPDAAHEAEDAGRASEFDLDVVLANPPPRRGGRAPRPDRATRTRRRCAAPRAAR